MPIADRARRWRALTALLVALLTAGCGGDKGTNPIVTPGLPENSTPAGAVARFAGSYARQSLGDYAGVFTADFGFTFSGQSDPTLVLEYGTSWGKDDELAAAAHLFDGFTSAEAPNETYGGATNIRLVMDPEIIDDLVHPDSSRYYKLAIVPSIDLQITILNGAIETIYEIASRQAFYLVRGDAARLDAGQPADSLHWYVKRWDDLSTAFPGVASTPGGARPGDTVPARVLPTEPASWGRLKAIYRR
jgi:hypothetical protein